MEGRARGAFIDYRVDNALTRDPANFMDYVHTSARAARQMEREIAARVGLARQGEQMTLAGACRRRSRFQPTVQPELARKAALDLAAGRFWQRAGTDQRDVAREDARALRRRPRGSGPCISAASILLPLGALDLLDDDELSSPSSPGTVNAAPQLARNADVTACTVCSMSCG